MVTTVQIDDDLKKRLNLLKIHPLWGSASSLRRDFINLSRRALSHFLIKDSDSEVRITSKVKSVNLPVNLIKSLDSTRLYVIESSRNSSHQFSVRKNFNGFYQ